MSPQLMLASIDSGLNQIAFWQQLNPLSGQPLLAYITDRLVQASTQASCELNFPKYLRSQNPFSQALYRQQGELAITFSYCSIAALQFLFWASRFPKFMQTLLNWMQGETSFSAFSRCYSALSFLPAQEKAHPIWLCRSPFLKSGQSASNSPSWFLTWSYFFFFINQPRMAILSLFLSSLVYEGLAFQGQVLTSGFPCPYISTKINSNNPNWEYHHDFSSSLSRASLTQSSPILSIALSLKSQLLEWSIGEFQDRALVTKKKAPGTLSLKQEKSQLALKGKVYAPTFSSPQTSLAILST